MKAPTRNKTWIWLALLGAPMLTLLNLSIVYALVAPACAEQNTLPLHLVSAISLLLCLLFTFMAWQQWQQYGVLPEVAEDDASARKSFLPVVAVISGLLSALVIAAQWVPQWVLSPCFA